MRTASLTAALVLLLFVVRPCPAADNELTPEEKAAGWQLLFNGRNYDGWKCNNGKDIQSQVVDGAMVPFKSGGYLIIYNDPSDDADPQKDKDRFGNYIFQCDVKMGEKATDGCNSGIFFRVGDPNDPVQTGLEMQVATGKSVSAHSYGAIYDAAKPTKNVSNGAGKWDRVQITCKGPLISIDVNGENVLKMNCDEYTEARKNPDGSKNKYRTPIKEFPRRGYVGFQDHFDGTKAYYKNVKLLRLDKPE